MKKNIEWLKKEIATEMIRLESNRAERWSDVKYQTLRSVAQKIDQLDEPEVLSQEWIDRFEQFRAYVQEQRDLSYGVELGATGGYTGRIANQYDGLLEMIEEFEEHNPIALQNLLVPTLSEMETVDITEGQIMDWLDDNEFYHHATAETVLANAVDKGELGYYGTKYSVVKKPAIPKYVADWIEDLKSKKIHLLESIYDFAHGEDINSYMRKQGDVLLRAWLDGFTIAIEEEPLYYALVKGHELTDGDKVYWVHDKNNEDMFIGILHSPSVYFLSEMSKSEWNELGINDSNADFVKVGEVK